MELQPQERLDVVNDDIKLIQRKNGLLFGTDAYLLAAYIRQSKGKTGAELGSGTGIVSLLSLSRGKFQRVFAIEAQEDFARLTARNAALNGYENALVTLHRDVRTVRETDLGGRVDAVFSNPPYMSAGAGKENEADEKNIARREILGGIGDFCACASRILKYGGLFYTVYRADRLCDLLEALRANGLEPKRLTFIHGDLQAKPVMVLVTSRLGGNPSLEVTRPLIVYRSHTEREYTEDMKRIYETCSFEGLEGFS